MRLRPSILQSRLHGKSGGVGSSLAGPKGKIPATQVVLDPIWELWKLDYWP